MNYIFEMEYPELPKMLNQMLRSHYFQRQRENEKWQKIIRHQLLVTGKMPPFPLKKATVTLTRYSSKSPDCDGLYGSFKSVIDSLVFNQLIVNDSPQHIQLNCFWKPAPQKKGKVSIKVEGELLN